MEKLDNDQFLDYVEAHAKVRINRMIEKLRALWLIYPDMRLGQLVNNMAPVHPAGGHCDAFYTEDDIIEKEIDKQLEMAAVINGAEKT